MKANFWHIDKKPPPCYDSEKECSEAPMKRLFSIFFLVLLLSGCAAGTAPGKVQVVFEDNDALYFPRQIYEIPRGEALSISVGVPTGCRIASVNYESYTLSPRTGSTQSFDYYTLTLSKIQYSQFLRLEIAPAYTTLYHADSGEPILVQEDSPHLFFNALPYDASYTRPGFLPVGWNTEPDGTGLSIGFGSRFDHRAESQMDLCLQWVPCNGESDFTYFLENGEAVLTGYSGTAAPVIPETLGGCPVTSIAAGAFGDLTGDLILPPSLKTIAPGSFGTCKLDSLTFFDTLEQFPEEAFAGYSVKTLSIQAATAPRYSGTYFDTLPDKMDYLTSLSGEKKLILLCGSSARFGYDSTALDAALPAYHTVNMGVFAYSNLRPLAEMVLQYAESGDILLSSPELDAIDAQFCASRKLEKETYAMVESNYGLLSRLDLSGYSDLFAAYTAFQTGRAAMEPKSYVLSPKNFDEDGNPQLTPAYNIQGDYILYRENNFSRKPFGIKRAFYEPDAVTEADFAGLNGIYDAFAARGVAVFFTYSPRSSVSLSPGSTPEAIEALDDLFARRLHAKIISSAADSILDPLYFSGTDNHLSTEGVAIHTQAVIGYLTAALSEGGRP